MDLADLAAAVHLPNGDVAIIFLQQDIRLAVRIEVAGSLDAPVWTRVSDHVGIVLHLPDLDRAASCHRISEVSPLKKAPTPISSQLGQGLGPSRPDAESVTPFACAARSRGVGGGVGYGDENEVLFNGVDTNGLSGLWVTDEQHLIVEDDHIGRV
jgi:hypothetical protein